MAGDPDFSRETPITAVHQAPCPSTSPSRPAPRRSAPAWITELPNASFSTHPPARYSPACVPRETERIRLNRANSPAATRSKLFSFTNTFTIFFMKTKHLTRSTAHPRSILELEDHVFTPQTRIRARQRCPRLGFARSEEPASAARGKNTKRTHPRAQPEQKEATDPRPNGFNPTAGAPRGRSR